MGGLLGGGGDSPKVIAPPPTPIPAPAVPLPTQNASDVAAAQQAIIRRRQTSNTILTDSEDTLGST